VAVAALETARANPISLKWVTSTDDGRAAAPYYQSDMIAGLLRVAQPITRSAYGPYEYYNVSVDDGALRAHLAAAGLGVPDAGAFQELSRWGCPGPVAQWQGLQQPLPRLEGV